MEPQLGKILRPAESFLPALKNLLRPSRRLFPLLGDLFQHSNGVKNGIEKLALREGFSVEQFLALAAGEKLAVMSSLEYLRNEAAQGSRADWDAYLDHVPDLPGLSGDELPRP